MKTEHSYTILLPIPGEQLGRWLEENNAIISILFTRGQYRVSVTKDSMNSRTEPGRYSVRRSSGIVISAYGPTLESALLASMNAAHDEAFTAEAKP